MDGWMDGWMDGHLDQMGLAATILKISFGLGGCETQTKEKITTPPPTP